MSEDAENKGCLYEFGKFVLDPQERVLLADGKPVHLSDKVFDTLLLLVEQNGRLLTKKEMMEALWEESFVEEGNLAKNISRLRKILTTDGESLIETLPKRGYRFAAPVQRIDGTENFLVQRRVSVKITRSVVNESELPTLTGDEKTRLLNELHKIAVLPFQPLWGKADDDFFGLGITDALITQLSRGGQIQVLPTSSILKYDLLEQNAVSIGRELKADAILEGRFQRSEGKLRLTVQMLLTANGDSLWADSFNAKAEDIFDVQDQIAMRVAGAFNKKLSEESEARLKKHYTENVDAYQEYLKGRYCWNKRTKTDYDDALRCFERAIKADPLYALAYAGLADVYNLLPLYDGFAPHDYFPKAKAAALKALAIDENLAEAHAALGLSILHYDWNWTGAEVSFRHAIRLNPNYSTAYELLGVYLCRVERIGEAIDALEKAQKLDPLSPINATWLAEVFRHYGKTAVSIRLQEEILKSFPDFYLAHYHLAFSYIDCNRFDKAEMHCQKAVSLSHENSLTLSLQGILKAKLGNKPAVRETLNKLLQTKTEKYVSSVNIASVYAASGNREKTIEWLETALKERDPNLTWIKFDNEFYFLRQYPRYQMLLKEIGLSDTSVETLPAAFQPKHSKRLLLTLCALAVLIISGFGFYFWKREKPVAANSQNSLIRLTDAPQDDHHAIWTRDNQIRFLRNVEKGTFASFVMSRDGNNQRRANETIKNLQTGFWSPDGKKVFFSKETDGKTIYLANSDGSDEIKLPFLVGNNDWSPDGKRIVYQSSEISGNSELFVYSLETGKIENITNNAAFDADPNFSPDGKQIVFVSNRDGNAEVYLINSDGSDVRRLTNHPAFDNHPVFSPDGTQIAFNSDRENENSNVYLMRTDGSDIRALTDWQSNESVEPGCWSGDGTQIVFSSDRNGNDDLFIISAEVFQPRLIFADEKSSLQFPSYSPDGKQIVYQAETQNKGGELRIFDVVSKQNRVLLKIENADIAPVFAPNGNWIAFQNRIEGNTEICLIKPDGSGVQNLTNNPARDASPSFSPDGKQIVFASNRGGDFGTYDLYAMNTDGGSNQRQIYSNKSGMSVSPVWSPDGKEIVFANDNGRIGNFEIFKVEFETGQLEKRLTFSPRYDEQPAVSPDGNLIAFVSNADGNSEIYVMNSDGTGLLRITRNEAEDITPRFTSDGKKIIYSNNRSGKFALYEIKISE